MDGVAEVDVRVDEVVVRERSEHDPVVLRQDQLGLGDLGPPAAAAARWEATGRMVGGQELSEGGTEGGREGGREGEREEGD